MKILIHGLQSSGSTLFAFFLCQDKNTLGILDYWGKAAPAPYIDVGNEHDLVCKCAVSPLFSFSEHANSFQPDLRILFKRNLSAVKSSLEGKYYKDDMGLLEDKLKLAENLNEKDYDIVLTFEDFLTNKKETVNKLERLARLWYYDYPRTRDELWNFTMARSQWCKDTYEKSWGYGNLHFDKYGKPDRNVLARVISA